MRQLVVPGHNIYGLVLNKLVPTRLLALRLGDTPLYASESEIEPLIIYP